MRTGFIRAVVWGLFAASVLAQTPPAQNPPAQNPPASPPAAPTAAQPDQQRPPTFRTGADLVRVDVSVIDRHGMPVSNLTANDFLIEEDGAPQSIQSFKFITVSGHPDEDDEISLPIRSRDHARAEAARDDVRVFLIFWDEYHISRLTSAVRAREFLTRFVLTAFGPKDLVAIMDPLTTLDSIRFTRDRRELANMVHTLRGRSGEYVPPRSVVEEAHLQAMRDIERLRSEVTMSAVKAAAVHLGGLRDGRKALIMITEGMRGLGRDEPTIMRDLVESANASNTGIFTINPMGLTMRRLRSFDMMEALATGTGAEFSSSNDPGPALGRIVSQASAYYLLGYASQKPLDGKFHKIRVRVKRDGLEIRARSGYWAPSVADMTRAKKAVVEAQLRPDIARAMGDVTPAGARRSIDLWAGTTLGQDGTTRVRVAWAPRGTDGGPAAPVPASVALVAAQGATRVFEGPIPAGGAEFTAPAGALQLTASVSDGSGEMIDRVVRTVTVDDLAASPLSIGAPSVLRARSSYELRDLRASASPPEFAGREFARTDRLLIRFAVHGPAAEAAEVTARLINLRGVRLSDIAIGRLTTPRSGFEIDLPLQSIARGDYLLAIAAARGADRAEVMVPLRIVR